MRVVDGVDVLVVVVTSGDLSAIPNEKYYHVARVYEQCYIMLHNVTYIIENCPSDKYISYIR